MVEVDVSILALFSLSACVFCLYLVFFFGRKLQLQAHLRNTLVDGTVERAVERGRRMLNDQARATPLDPIQNPFPLEASDIGLSHNLWLGDPVVRQGQLFLPRFEVRECPDYSYMDYTYEEYIDDGGDPSITQEVFEKEEQRRKEQYLKEEKRRKAQFEKEEERRKVEYDRQKFGIQKYMEWETRERTLFEVRSNDLEQKARQEIEDTFPEAMDISILGTGFSFLLEFSTVIVIIFALITLGILGTFEGREIAAILAAIAGYVLGKGASSQTRKVERSQQTSSATQKTVK